ncbi:MAG: BatA domain-containing protein [Fuerstiella sp.]
MSWLTQYFLNPGFVLPGAALASVPIIIHLLSRLRYKRVRFAAMEFLLQSDELNRRRLIIEQLLLLFLRVLAVLLIMLLLARLVLDPSRLMLLRGATTHHVLILDDSLSMRQLVDTQTVFSQAQATLEKMLSQRGNAVGSLRVTVMTMTQPDRPLVTDRALDNALVEELLPRLGNLTCSYKAVSPTSALAAAVDVLSGDGGVAPQVHVLTDLRRSDWTGQPDVVQALESLDAIDAQVSLIQVSPKSADNVVLSQLSADTLAVAAGVPWRMNLTFRNHGEKVAGGLRATVSIDGNALPVKVLVPDIESGTEIQLAHDISFQTPGQHEVQVQLEDDALPEDNLRYLVVDVTDKRSVLIVDDDARQEDAGYVAAALSADPQLTGLAAEIRQASALTTEKLDAYDCIYLLNVRELPADAVQLLKDYVVTGGGVAWFPDEQANTTWYNTTLQRPDIGLFPVPLSAVQSIPATQQGEEPQFQHPVFDPHPIFAIYNIPDSPFADLVQISRWFQVSSEWSPDSADNVRVLARLKNGDPLVLEQAVGQGRVLTFLLSAGRRWSNWPVSPAAPGYVVMHLLMHQYLQKADSLVQVRELGEPVRFEWPVSRYTESVEVFLPEDNTQETTATSFLRLQAAPMTSAAAAVPGSLQDNDAAGPDPPNTDPPNTVPSNTPPPGTALPNTVPPAGDSEGRLVVTIPQADRPGVYRIKRFQLDGESEDTWLALSVSATESDLTVAEAGAVEQQLESGHVRVIAADIAGELSASDAGRELRWLVLGLLLAALVCEQILSLHMSYHPEVKS